MKKLNVLFFILALCLLCQYDLKGQKWNPTRDVSSDYIGWEGNPESLKVLIDPGWNAAQKAKIRNGMKKWNDAGGKPALVEAATPPAEITVAKEPAESADEGSFTPTFNGTSKKWVSGEITLKEIPSTTGLDLEEVAAHEFGHALGLADTDSEKNPSDVMKGDGPSNGSNGGLSNHDITEMNQAAEFAIVGNIPQQRAVSPASAVRPGDETHLLIPLTEPVPVGSTITVTPLDDPDLEVLNAFVEGNMLNVMLFVSPLHGSGTIYLNVHIIPMIAPPINFIGIHFVNLNPVPKITFECPFAITETDGLVYVEWEELHTYPFSGGLRSRLVVDALTRYENRPIGNYAISLEPGMHTFELYLDDYQVNSAYFSMNYFVIGSGGSTTINHGEDSWTIPCGTIAFGQEGDYMTLPEDFFGSGSDPFDGIISLIGLNSNGSQQPVADAAVSRLVSVDLNEPYPSIGTLPTEITQLKLAGSEPVKVSYGCS